MKQKSASSIIHKEHINYKITLNIRRVKTITVQAKKSITTTIKRMETLKERLTEKITEGKIFGERNLRHQPTCKIKKQS